MNGTMLLLRVIHIACGVYWAGTAFFVAQFLEPVVRGAGPAGAPVMLGLQARKYFAIMPAIAGLSILSGAIMMWIDSSGFSAAWMSTRPGMGFSAGALFAIAGLIVGVSVLRPAGDQMQAVMQQAMLVPDGPERAARMASAAVFRDRVTLGARWMAALLFVAVVAMSISRYL
jgi:hypothetical protein